MKVKAFLFATLAALAAPAWASPWAEVGDNQLRADIEFLAASGVLDGLTTHWPLAWASVQSALARRSLASQPEAVRAAAARVMARAQAETTPGFSAGLFLDGTNSPSVVYGFDGMGRAQGQGQAFVAGTAGIFSGRIALGAISGDGRTTNWKLMPDGSYLAADLGGARLYAGYLDHWWGPGQVSALSVSNNARPMPQVGIERASTEASSWPLLNLLGPFQAEFFLGYLDGPRIEPDTYYNGLRFTVHPLKGLEVGFTRTEQFCGQGHGCSPLRDYFHFSNNPFSVNNTNDEIDLDIKYAGTVASLPFQLYTQVMDEDYSILGHPVASHLFGGSVFIPVASNPLKLTLEYTDTVPTVQLFSFGDVLNGSAYNNGQYPDGLRYRGRTLGFSLDSDSRLWSLQANWSDADGWFYQLSLHHAAISTPQNTAGNVVTTAPVTLNLGEARLSLPWKGLKLDLAGRLQDDQPRPHSGVAAAVEVALRQAF